MLEVMEPVDITSAPFWLVIAARKHNARALQVYLCGIRLPYADVDQTSSYALLDFAEAFLGGWR